MLVVEEGWLRENIAVPPQHRPAMATVLACLLPGGMLDGEMDVPELRAMLGLAMFPVVDGFDADGNAHGLHVNLWENGQTRAECTYEHGKMHGTYRGWHENGTLCDECEYEYGKLHGRRVSLHPNGRVRILCLYEHDDIHGPYEEWWPNGRRYLECSYDHGELHGPYTSWRPNGCVNVTCTYESGALHGKYDAWTSGGVRTGHAHYWHGTRVLPRGCDGVCKD